MFHQLSYFHSMENDLNKLTQSSQKINELLFKAYSPPDKSFCQLDSQIDSIISEEQYLQQALSVIEVQVNTNSFLPERLDEIQLLGLDSSINTLPAWFSAVLQEQYSSQRKAFNVQALNLFRLHELSQKRKTLANQSQNLNALFRRTKLNSTGLNPADIINEATLVRDGINHVRKSFQYFCSQVARKVSDWVHHIAQKSRNFNKNTTKLATEPSKEYQFKREAFLNTTNKSGRLLQISKYSNKDPNQANFLQLSKRYRQTHLLEEFYGGDTSKYKNIEAKKDVAIDFRRSPYRDISKQSQTTNMYAQRAIDVSKYRDCYNHKAVSPDFHRHTCNTQTNGLGRVKSTNNLQVFSPHRQRKFDYRKVIQTQYM